MRDPEPQILGGDGEAVLVWGSTVGELAGALELLSGFLAGRRPPGGTGAPQRLSGRLAAVRDLCAQAARDQQAARHRELATVSAQPSPVVSVLLPSAQAAGPSDTVTVAEASDILGVTPERVRQLAAAGRIKGQRTARRVWILERASVASHRTRRQRSATHGSKPDH